MDLEAFLGLKMLSSSGLQKMNEIGLWPFFFILLASLLVSLFISHLYVRFYGTKGTGSTLHRSFPLLGVSITAIFVSLQFSIPLSLGLLGALSIVRFRTPIKDPEEVGFILLVIASSLSCATFNMAFLSLILAVSIIGMIILKVDKRIFRKTATEGMLVLKVPSDVYKHQYQKLLDLVKKGMGFSRIDSILEEGDQCTMTYTFSNLPDSDAIRLQLSLKEVSPEISLNIYYSGIEH